MKTTDFMQSVIRYAGHDGNRDVRQVKALRLLASAFDGIKPTAVSTALGKVPRDRLQIASGDQARVSDALKGLEAFRCSLDAQERKSFARDLSAFRKLISGRDSGSVESLAAALREAFACHPQSRGKRKRNVNQPIVDSYLQRLEAALQDSEAFKSVFSELDSDPKVGQAEAVAIARAFIGKTATSVSRSTALEKIYSRHGALMDFKAKRKAFGGRTAA